MNGMSFIELLFLSANLKSNQILCANKPYFLMPAHIQYNLKLSSYKRLGSNACKVAS